MAASTLKSETAAALLEAIKEAAPSANERGTDALEHLANAYAAVVTAMPKSDSVVGTGRKTATVF